MDAITAAPTIPQTSLPQSLTQTVSADKQVERTKEVAREFVGFYLGQILKTMRSTVQQSEFGHGGNGEKFFQELMDEELGRDMAKDPSMGLTNLVAKSLLQRSGTAVLPADTRAAAAGYGRK